jgi:Flp pilus assembly protein TadD
MAHTLKQLLAEGRIGEARDEATRQLSRKPGDEEALLTLAKVALVDNRPEQAEQLLSRVKSEDAQPEVALLLGAVAIQSKEFGRAREHYEKLVRQPSPPAEAWHGLGLALIALGEVAQGREAHERAVALRPQQSGFRFELGLALIMEERIREAVRELVQSLRLEAREARGYWALAQVLARQGKDRSARRILEAGLKHVPQSPLLRETLEANPESTGAREEGPEVELARQALQFVELKRGREALTLLREAEAQGMRSLPLKLLEAEASKLLQPPDLECVIHAYEEAIALAPEHWEAYTRLGVFLLKQGRRYEVRAIERLETARRLEPSMPETSLNLVLAYVKAQRIAEARDLAQQVVKGLTPGHALYEEATRLLEALRKV